MGLTGNPRASSGPVLTASAWPGVPESLLKFVATVQTALLPGPPLDPEGVIMVLNETPLPPPPVAPEAPKKEQRARKKGQHNEASDEEDDGAQPLGGSGEDVFKSRQAAKLRKKT